MSYIPDNHNHVSPYLIVKKAEPLVAFLKNTFDGEEILRVMDDDGEGIIHVEIKIKDSVIMIGESSEKFKETNSFMHVYVENVDKTFKRAIKNGATSTHEPANQPDGDRRGTVLGPQGIYWTVATKISQ